ncbi:hypothetical protein, partial [Mycobacterium sp. E1386]|uniref:hypothetical protein n=1 Tax=Mycobacterium sp. E1386 TaxID=1834126 RepID=UPI001E5C5566
AMKAAIAAATAAVFALGLPTAAPAHADTTATVKAQSNRMNGPNLKAGQDGVYNAGQVLTLVSRRGSGQTQGKNGCRRCRDCCLHRSVFLPRPYEIDRDATPAANVMYLKCRKNSAVIP